MKRFGIALPVAAATLALSTFGLYHLARAQGVRPPQATVPRTDVQVRSEVESYAKKPLIIFKIDGTQTPHIGDYGSEVLSGRAALTFTLPDRPDLPREADVQLSVENVGDNSRKFKKLAPTGRFPNSNSQTFEQDTPNLVKPQLSTLFNRESMSYHLSLSGRYKKADWNKPGKPTATEAVDVLAIVNIIDRQNKIWYYGRAPLRVIMTQIVATN